MSRRAAGPKTNVQRRIRPSQPPALDPVESQPDSTPISTYDESTEFSQLQTLTSHFQPSGIDSLFSQSTPSQSLPIGNIPVSRRNSVNQSKYAQFGSFLDDFDGEDTMIPRLPGDPQSDTATLKPDTSAEELDSHFSFDFSRLYTDPATTIQTEVKSKMLIQIQNMVGVVDLGSEVDMKLVAMCAKNAEYNPRRFMSVVLRLREPKTTALLFKSGKLVVTGGKSEYQTRLAARKFARLIQRIGHPNITFNDFRINNIVGTIDVRFPIDLNAFVKDHSLHCEYDPELFPSLVYRLHNPNVVALIFVNGKIIITGASDRTQLYNAFEILYPVLLEYRKGGTMSTCSSVGVTTLPPPSLSNVTSLSNSSISGNTSFGNVDFFSASFNNGLQTTSESLLNGGFIPAATGDPGFDDAD